MTLTEIISLSALIMSIATVIIVVLIYNWTRRDRKEEKTEEKKETITGELAEYKVKLAILEDKFNVSLTDQKEIIKKVDVEFKKIEEQIRNVISHLQAVERVANYARQHTHEHSVFGRDL